MASKATFVLAIAFIAIVVGILACLGWIHGCAWWRRKEHYQSPSS